jgi:hypothetical protein
MVPPVWLDESGQPRPVRQWARCADLPLPPRASAAHWLAAVHAGGVRNWCGHGQEFVQLPDEDGWCRLVPVMGEAT